MTTSFPINNNQQINTFQGKYFDVDLKKTLSFDELRDVEATKKQVSELQYLQENTKLSFFPEDPKYDFKNHIGMKFITIPTGNGSIGACSGWWNCLWNGKKFDDDALSNEFPTKSVEIATNLQVSIFETTLGNYKQFATDTGVKYDFIYSTDEYPAVMVSFEDALAFIDYLNETKPIEDSGYYRLPSEAEWEYFTNAGSTTPFYFGNRFDIKNKANCVDCLQKENPAPTPVGYFPPNAWGLYDLHGNVDEWVLDCYKPNTFHIPSNGQPYQTNGCPDILAKGGSWEYTSETLRTTWRDYYPRNAKTWEQGFRVVREIQD